MVFVKNARNKAFISGMASVKLIIKIQERKTTFEHQESDNCFFIQYNFFLIIHPVAYIEILQRLSYAIKNKKLGMLSSEVVLMYNNPCLYASAPTREELQKL